MTFTDRCSKEAEDVQVSVIERRYFSLPMLLFFTEL